MLRFAGVGCACAIVLGGAYALASSDLDVEQADKAFVESFNSRDWEGLRAHLADDIVFHRANADTVQVGEDAVIEHFSSVIGNPEQWNVKFTMLDTSETFTGKDGRVVERGDFAVTAGPDDNACYRGSYLATWAAGPDGPQLQMLAWQDVEAELGACKT